MFTGLIQEIGQIQSIQEKDTGKQFTFSATKILHNANIGDSIAIDGVCSTITTLQPDHFTVDYMPETLKSTTLNTKKVHTAVNLESCLTLNDKLGGHLVSGHIDTIGTIINITLEHAWHTYHITYPKAFAAFLIHKGSIAVDGISLTISKLESETFSISLIPHTLQHTTLKDRHINDTVNLEFDMIGKFILRQQTLQGDTINA